MKTVPENKDQDEDQAGAQIIALLRQVDKANSLLDIGKAIDEYCQYASYKIHHIVMCKLDNMEIRDVLYTTPHAGTGIFVEEFSHAVRIATIEEVLRRGIPLDIMTDEYPVSPPEKLQAVRTKLKNAGIKNVTVIPFTIENSISVVVVNVPDGQFAKVQHEALPVIYQLLSHTFERFPTLKKWSDEYRLTRREAEILHLTSIGHGERDIAEMLTISANTVRNHIENCKRKLDARNKTHAIAIANLLGEIDAINPRRR